MSIDHVSRSSVLVCSARYGNMIQQSSRQRFGYRHFPRVLYLLQTRTLTTWLEDLTKDQSAVNVSHDINHAREEHSLAITQLARALNWKLCCICELTVHSSGYLRQWVNKNKTNPAICSSANGKKWQRLFLIRRHFLASLAVWFCAAMAGVPLHWLQRQHLPFELWGWHWAGWYCPSPWPPLPILEPKHPWGRGQHGQRHCMLESVVEPCLPFLWAVTKLRSPTKLELLQSNAWTIPLLLVLQAPPLDGNRVKSRVT